MSKEELQLIVHAVDETTKTMQAIRDSVLGVGNEVKSTGDKVDSLGSKLSSLGNLLKTGFVLQAGADIFSAIQSGISWLIQAIPNAIAVGNAWAETVHQVAIETGMAAAPTSELLAIFQDLGIPVDNAGRIFAQFGKQLQTNTKLLNELGVATVDSNGKQLDAYTILENLRSRVSQYGSSLTETAAAQTLFGRTGYELLSYLQLSDAQFKALAADAQASGLVLSDQALEGARAFNIELGSLGDTLQGLQTQIFAGLAPTLTAFVDGFKNFLQDHMTQIVTFVVNAANFVMGVIGGLLGIQFDAINLGEVLAELAASSAKASETMPSATKNAAAAKQAEDALTKSINAQIDAIDKQIGAIDAREAARKAADQRAQLVAAANTAQSQLNDLLGSAPDTAGMSAAQAVLAQQKYSQDVLDDRKALSDALAAIANYDADQHDEAEKSKLEATKSSLQQQLSAHKTNAASQAAVTQGIVGSDTKAYNGIAASVAKSFAAMNASALQWRDNGVAFAKSLQDAIGGVMAALVGSDKTIYNIHDQAVRTEHKGGLIDAIGTVGDAFSWLGGQIADFVNFLSSIKLPDLTKTSGPPGDTTAMMQDILNHPPGSQFQLPNFDLFSGPHAGGGLIPTGAWGTVGERAMEIVRSTPAGAEVVPIPGLAGGVAAHSHEMVVQLDGYTVGRAIDQRNARIPRTTSIRGGVYGHS